METTKSTSAQTISRDMNTIQALEIIAATAGDVRFEVDEPFASRLYQGSAGTGDWEGSGDIPLAPRAMLHGSIQNDELDRELSLLRYRRRVVSQWPASPEKLARIAGIDSRFATLHPV
jgi:hypothetical protein